MLEDTSVTDSAADRSNIANAPWTISDMVRATLLSLLLMALGGVVILGVGLVLRLAGLSIDGQDAPITVAMTVVQNVSFAFAVWFFGLRKHSVGVERLGFRPFAAAAGCSYAAFAMLLAFGFNAFYSVISNRLDRPLETQPVLDYFGGGLFGFAVALTIAAGLVPFVEEMFFRGFLLPGLTRRFGLIAGIIVSSALFGAAHMSPDTFLPLSFFGVVLALLYSATGSIYPGIVVHSINNSIALLAAYMMELGLLSGL